MARSSLYQADRNGVLTLIVAVKKGSYRRNWHYSNSDADQEGRLDIDLRQYRPGSLMEGGMRPLRLSIKSAAGFNHLLRPSGPVKDLQLMIELLKTPGNSMEDKAYKCTKQARQRQTDR
jgi:hypothetical protein